MGLNPYLWNIFSVLLCSSSSIYSSIVLPLVWYMIQLNVYKRLLETLYGLSIVEMCLVILHPDNDSFITIPVYEMKKEIDYIFKERKAAFSKKAAPKTDPVKA